MSTVVLDTITGKSTSTTITIGSTPVVSASANSMTIRGEGSAQTSIQQGLAKAWIHIDTSTVQDSFNNSSITDNSVGNNTNTLANNMSNANYAVPSSTNAIHYSNVESYATSGYRHRTTNTSASAADRSDNVTTVHGDLA